MATTQTTVGGVPQFTLNAAGDVAAIGVGANQTVGIVVSGTWTGSLSLEATIDGSRYDAVSGNPIPAGTSVSSITGNGAWAAPVGGFAAFRVRLASNPTPTGAPVVSLSASPGAMSTIFTQGVQYPPAVPMETPDTATATHANAVITCGAALNSQHCLTGILYSYSAAPTGGRLTLADGSLVCLDIDITAAGPGFVPFPLARGGTPGSTLVATLYDGGAAIVGKLNLLGHYMVGGGGSYQFSFNFGQPAASQYIPLLGL